MVSNFPLTRNIFSRGKHANNGLHLHSHDAVRTITVMAGVNEFDAQGLASAKPFEDMPKIPILPIIGSSWIYFPFIGRYNINKLHVADREKRKKYGDIVREKFGHLNIVTSFVPEAMEIMSLHEGKYPVRGEIATIKLYRESRKEWYKTLGLILLNGKEWGDLRIKTQKHLMKPKTIQAYLNPMQDVARDFVKLVNQKRDAKKEVEGFIEDLNKWSLESVAYVGLDTRLGCLEYNLDPNSDGKKLIESVQTQFHLVNKMEALVGNFPFWKYLPSPSWKKYCKAADVFTEISFKYINRSLDSLKKRTDEDTDLTMLQSMLMKKDLDVSGAMVTVADMLMAGIDSTSHTVGFLLYRLAKNPEKQKILAEELKQLLPNKTDRITPEIFSKLRYLKACMKESIRIDPIVRGNVRTLDHDVVLSGYRVPAGTIIMCILQQIYRDERYFKNPDQFIPERWLGKDDKLENPFAFVPFGVGTRSCIGRRLAELEILCLTAEVIRNFSVEYHYEDIDMYTRLVSIPDKPLRFNFLDR